MPTINYCYDCSNCATRNKLACYRVMLFSCFFQIFVDSSYAFAVFLAVMSCAFSGNCVVKTIIQRGEFSANQLSIKADLRK